MVLLEEFTSWFFSFKARIISFLKPIALCATVPISAIFTVLKSLPQSL